jgi:plasminogen activator inhibitor 1 RNA-binding protein
MSVATKNPFAILEGKSFVFLSYITLTFSIEDPSRPTTPAQPPAVDPPLPPPKVNQKPKTGPAARGGRYYQRGGAPPKGDAAPQDAPAPNSDAPRKRCPLFFPILHFYIDNLKVDGDPRGRGRGKGRGDRGDRHRAGADGEGRGRGRQFDKHSQTGKMYVSLSLVPPLCF